MKTHENIHVVKTEVQTVDCDTGSFCSILKLSKHITGCVYLHLNVIDAPPSLRKSFTCIYIYICGQIKKVAYGFFHTLMITASLQGAVSVKIMYIHVLL